MTTKVLMIPFSKPSEDITFRDKVIQKVLNSLKVHTDVCIKFPLNPSIPEDIYTGYFIEWEKVFKSVNNLSCLIGNHMIQIKKVKKVANSISFTPDEFLHILAKYVPDNVSKINTLVFTSIYEPDEYVYFYIDGDVIVDMTRGDRYPISTYVNNIILPSDHIIVSDKYTVMRTQASTTVVPISLIKDTLKSDSDAREEILSGLEGAQIV